MWFPRGPSLEDIVNEQHLSNILQNESQDSDCALSKQGFSFFIANRTSVTAERVWQPLVVQWWSSSAPVKALYIVINTKSIPSSQCNQSTSSEHIDNQNTYTE